MGFGSQSGQVIIRTQAVQGTFQADLPTSGIGLKPRIAVCAAKEVTGSDKC